ncbi:hypothetical protein O181_003478 [Austropuccinia psidii MF-1]|uniref:Amino acid permease/ SLC12A domain-containing protein n=1 Tax=Austropuccinia psidii MF-1 TaxID=1389203 RepID=A0A9Q3GDL4_9BASI|nr:hypothetical protein [Austropuccinia psidii MF-1]
MELRKSLRFTTQPWSAQGHSSIYKCVWIFPVTQRLIDHKGVDDWIPSHANQEFCSSVRFQSNQRTPSSETLLGAQSQRPSAPERPRVTHDFTIKKAVPLPMSNFSTSNATTVPTPTSLPEPQKNPLTSQRSGSQLNLAQIILKKKQSRKYKEESHPKAFFIKSSGPSTGKGKSNKTFTTVTSSQIVRSPNEFEFPPFSLESLSPPAPVGTPHSQININNEPDSRVSPDLTSNALIDPPFSAYKPGNSSSSSDSETQLQLAWLGYHQELRRDWDFWSSLALSTLNIGTVPGAFLGVILSLQWGGPVVLIWGYLLGMFILLCLSAVVAEISSAYPVAGAMLTWSFKLARANPRLKEWARYISWLVGTLLFMAHVLIQVALTSQFTSLVRGLVTWFRPSWQETNWQKFLLNAGHLAICGFLLTTAPIRSPRLWKILGGISLVFYAVICISLIVGPRLAGAQILGAKSHLKMLVTFKNETDFHSHGLLSDLFVFLMGSSLNSLAFGAEASAHLAEETRKPASTVPKALFTSTAVSYILGLILNICLISAFLSPLPIETAERQDLLGLLFSHCTSELGTLILVFLLALMFFQDIAQLFAASRFTWALARDNAFPGSKIWKKVSGGKSSEINRSIDQPPSKGCIPQMAILLVVGCSVVGTAALELNENVFSDALIISATYLVVICYLVPLVIYLSCDKDVLEYDGRNIWRIPKLSRTCAWLAIASLIFVLILMACPTGLPITTQSWSWSPLVTICFSLLSTLGWILYGSKNYIGPIKSITFWTTGQEVDFNQLQINKVTNYRDDKQDEATLSRGSCALGAHLSREDTPRDMNRVFSISRGPSWPVTITTTIVTEFSAGKTVSDRQ